MTKMTKMIPLDQVLEILTRENERLILEAASQERAGNMAAAAGMTVCAHEVEALWQIVQDVFSEKRALS